MSPKKLAFKNYLANKRKIQELLWDEYQQEIVAKDSEGNIVEFDIEGERCQALDEINYEVGEGKNKRTVTVPTTRDIWWQLCKQLADKNTFNPAKDYFNSLKKPKKILEQNIGLDWFGTDYDLFSRAGFDDREQVDGYMQAAFDLIFKSMHLRTTRPGCKQDYLFILLGTQGIGKSLFCRLACPNDSWFLEGLSGKDLCGSVKELGRIIKGRMLCEVGEMNLGQRNKEAYKNIVSQQALTYDPKYLPHRTVMRCDTMIATSNHDELLAVDSTGNRRMIVLPVVGKGGDMMKRFSELKEKLDAQMYNATTDEVRLLNESHTKMQERIADLLTHTDQSHVTLWIENKSLEWFSQMEADGIKDVCISYFFYHYREQIKEELGRVSDHAIGRVWRGLGLKQVSRAMVNRKYKRVWRVPKELRKRVAGVRPCPIKPAGIARFNIGMRD